MLDKTKVLISGNNIAIHHTASEKELKLSFPLVVLYTLIPVGLDFAYPLKPLMLLLFSVYLLFLTYFIFRFNFKWVLWTFLFMICMVDDGPKMLYEFAEGDFFSVLEPLFGPLSTFHLTLFLFAIGVVAHLLMKGKLNVFYPLLFMFLLIFGLGFLMALIFQKQDEAFFGGLSMRHLLCLAAFVIPFMYTYNGKMSRDDLFWVFRHYIMFCIGKSICSLVLLALGRFSLWGGLVMTTSPAHNVTDGIIVFIFYLVLKQKHGWLAFLLSLLVLFEAGRRFQRGLLVNYLWIGGVILLVVLMKNKLKGFVIKNLAIVSVLVVLITIVIIVYYEELVVIQQIEQEFSMINEAGSGGDKDIRVVEWKNIMGELSENPVSLLFGGGMNNLMEFKHVEFYNFFTTSDYSKEMIASGHFYPHSFFNIITMKSGLVGIVVYFGVGLFMFYLIFKMNYEVEYASALQFFPLLLLMFWFSTIWTMPCSLVVSIGYAPLWGVLFANRHLFQRQT